VKKLLCLFLVSAFAALCFAQKPGRSSALQSMVDAERAFARMSEEQGIRPSFMAFIAEDGILFRPTAVKGKQWMMAHPLPASDKRPLLSWQPTFADMSRAGDMGYTTGPWEYKDDINDAKPVAFGNFLTVWRKQSDGSWKFAIDLGISNPQPKEAAIQWQLPKNYKQPSPGRMVSEKSERAALLARDREFSSVSATWSSSEAFLSHAANSVRLFRNGGAPVVGKEAAALVLPKRPSQWTWEPAFADVSRSGDLGYTYGTYRLTNESSPTTMETGNYFRIWKKQENTWKVVADLLDPLPEPKKN
jgi:ketosteroid isomerase-like protein